MARNPVIAAVRRRAGVVLRAAHLWPTTRVRAKRLATGQQRLRDEVRALRADLREARAHGKDTQKRLTALEKQLRQVQAMAPALDLLLGRRLPGMNRAVSAADIDTLIRQVAGTTQVKRADHHVATGFATLIELEARGLGRIAGTTQNVVGKLTTTPLLDPPNDDILEIGTLFGLHAAGLYRQFARRGRRMSVTIIDPLDGLQLQSGRNDQLDRTAVPVIEDVVRTNFALAGVPEQQVRVLRGYSQDEAVRAAAADRRYGTIVVDGDHSAEGVARDLAWAEEIIADGGIIVLDDYGDPKWSGVQTAVDEHLAQSSRLALIAVVATSAYLRAQPVPADDARSQDATHEHEADLQVTLPVQRQRQETAHG